MGALTSKARCRVFLSVSSHFLFIKNVEKKLPLPQFLSDIAKLIFGVSEGPLYQKKFSIVLSFYLKSVS